MRKRMRALLSVVVVLALLIWWWLRRSKDWAARRIEVRETEAEPLPLDELKRIEGIGPKIAALLQNEGIQTFASLARTGSERLREILREAGLPFVDPATWPEQAALAAVGKWEELAALQGELKGGRRA